MLITLKRLAAIILFVVATLGVAAQEVGDTTNAREAYKTEVDMLARKMVSVADSAVSRLGADGMLDANGDSLAMLKVKPAKQKRDWTTWKPDVKQAMWLAIVIPGGGQIYNRKYWKLPIVYGGFVGCVYAWRWNGQMYSDYSQAYLDICDDDPNTRSYEKFLHMGMVIDESNIDRFKNLFRRRKDLYRRYRDLSVFCTVGVYLLSIIDAYVDASLSQFDISDDLSMKVTPAVLAPNGNLMTASRTSSLSNSALGVRCQLNF